MRRPHAFIALTVGATLAITATATPVAAAEDPEIVIVQGIPGLRVDVCINGEEVRKNLRYGKKFKPDLATGQTKIVLKPKRKGDCAGATIAKVKFTAVMDEQATFVARRRGGQRVLQRFSDQLISSAGSPAVIDQALIVSNGSSFGTVDGWLASGFTVTAPNPTFGGIAPGRQSAIAIPEEGTVAAWFSRPGKTKSLLLPAVQQAVSGQRNHFMLVGTKRKNLRTVSYKTAFLP